MIFGLQKELGKSGMRLVGGARIESQLGIACNLQRAWLFAAVGQGDAANLRVGTGHDRDLVTALHFGIAATDDRAVRTQIRLILVGISPDGLATRGPDAAIVQVADVAVLAPAIAGMVFAPASDVHPLKRAVTSP